MTWSVLYAWGKHCLVCHIYCWLTSALMDITQQPGCLHLEQQADCWIFVTNADCFMSLWPHHVATPSVKTAWNAAWITCPSARSVKRVSKRWETQIYQNCAGVLLIFEGALCFLFLLTHCPALFSIWHLGNLRRPYSWTCWSNSTWAGSMQRELKLTRRRPESFLSEQPFHSCIMFISKCFMHIIEKS